MQEAGPRLVKPMPDDGTAQLLRAGIWILVVGGLAALLTATVFGGIGDARAAYQLRLACAVAGDDVPAVWQHADAAGSGQVAAQSPAGAGTRS